MADFDPFQAGAEPIETAPSAAEAFDPFAAGAEPTGFNPFKAGAEEHKPKFTTFEEFTAPVGQAFANLPARGAQVLDFAKLLFQKPIDEFTGDFTPSIELAAQMAERSKRLAADREVVVQASGTAGGVATDVASAAADLIPQLLLSGGFGLLSSAKAAITASAALGGMQSAGNSFAANVAERTAKGEELGAAAEAEFVPSLASGAITGAITKAFGASGVESVFKAVGARGVSAKLFQVLKEAGSEASEEMIDEGGQWINDLVNNKKVPIDEAVKRVAYAGFLGGVLGGGVAGMHQAVTSFRPDVIEAEGAISRARTVAPQTADALQSVVDQNITEAEESLMPVLPAAAPSPDAPTATQRIAAAQANLKAATAAGDPAGIAAAEAEIGAIAGELIGGQTAAREQANASVTIDAKVNANREITPETVIDPRDTEMAKRAAESLGLRYDGVQGDAAVNITDPATGNTLTLEPGTTVAQLQERVAAKTAGAPPAAPAPAAPPAAVPPVIPAAPLPEAPSEIDAAFNSKASPARLAFLKSEGLLREVPAVIPAAPLPEVAPAPTKTEIALANRRTDEEKATQIAEGTAAVRAEVEKTGIVPTYEEIRQATLDPKAASAMRKELQAQMTAAYPAEALPEGATQDTAKNALTGDLLPSVNEGGKLRPQFTNDPNLTAQQIDTGAVGTDKANRLYVPDEIMDADQLNPAIDTAYDKEAGKFYVVSANTPYGLVAKPDDFAVPYRAAKSLQKAHQLVLAGTPDDVQRLHDFVKPDENTVGQALTENGFAADVVAPFEPGEIEIPDGAVAVAAGTPATTAQAKTNIELLMGTLLGPDGKTAPDGLSKLIQKIAGKELPVFPWMRIMAQQLLKSGVDLSKITFTVVNRPNAKYAGLYRVNPDDVTRGSIDLNLASAQAAGAISTVLHEVFHHASLVKMNPFYKRNTAEQKAYDNLGQLFVHASREIYKLNYGQYPTGAELAKFQNDQAVTSGSPAESRNRTYYGLTSLEEFVAEALSNPRFMKVLSQITGLPGVKQSGKFKTLLAAVRDAIKTLFIGASTRNSTLNQAMDQTLAFIAAGTVDPARARKTGYAGARSAPPVVVDEDGWLGPDGKFHPAPMTEGGHESIATTLIGNNEKLSKDFYTNFNPEDSDTGQPKADDVFNFMEQNGFVRVVGGGRGGTLYITGRPTNSQRRLLMDNAIEQGATLVHDFGGRSRTLFSPGQAFSAAGDRQSTTAMAGALESASPFVRTALSDTTYLTGNNQDDLKSVQTFIQENMGTDGQLDELITQLDLTATERFSGLDDVQRGLARIQISHAADKMAAQLADNIANKRPVTDVYGRTLGISGTGQELLVRHYQQIAVEQGRIAQLELSKSGAYLSRVGALVARMFTPAKAKADYTDPIKAVQQTTLRGDAGTQAIRTAFEETRQAAATAAVDKADKVLQLVTGLQQDAFAFYEGVFGKGSLQKSAQWLSRFSTGSGLPVTTDIANSIAANMVKAFTPKKAGKPQPVLAQLQAEVQTQVAAQIEAALPQGAPAAVTHSALQTFIKDTDHAALMEQAFNTAVAKLNADPAVTPEQKAALTDARFDLGQLKSAQVLIRQYLDLKDVVHRNLSVRNANRDTMIHDILEAAPHLSEAQTGAVMKALTSAFDAASQTELKAQLANLTKSRAAVRPGASHFEDYLKLANFGIYTDEALYNTVAANNPKLKLPVYDAAFLASIDAEAGKIMLMPDDSDLRRTAVAALNTKIAAEQVKTLRGKEKAWHYIGKLGPSVWQAGVLSGPPTQLVNVGSTAVNVQKEAFFDALGYSVAAVKAGAPLSQVGNFFADGVMGWFNQGRSRQEVRRSLTTGVSKFRSERGEGASILETLSKKNPYHYFKWVLRIATAADGFNGANANEIKQRMILRYAMIQDGRNAAEIDAAMTDAFNPAKEVFDQIEAQAAQEAAQGLFKTKLEQETRINELLEKRRDLIVPGLVEEGRANAEVWTFNGQPKGLAGVVFDGAIGSMNAKFPPAKYIFSFMRTMANLLNTTLDFSPVGVARAYNFHVTSALNKTSKFRYADIQRGSPEFYAKLGQGVAGTAAIFALAAMGMKGLEDEKDGKEPFFGIYGSGPSTAIERRQLIEGAGWQPNSIKIGPHRFAYLDWPVLNLALGALGTIMDDVRYKRNQNTGTGERATLMALGLMNVIMSKRLLQGASNLFTVIQNPDQRGITAAKQITSGLVGGFTNPQALKWSRNTLGMGADGMVPVLDATTTKGWLYSMMPASGGYTEAGLNVLGEEVKEFPWVATTKRFGVFDPVKAHPVLTPLVKAGLEVPPPSKDVGIGIGDQVMPMGRNPEIWRAFVKYRGAALKKIFTPERIAQLVAMDQFDGQQLMKGVINEVANADAKTRIVNDIKAGKLPVAFQTRDPKLNPLETTEPTP